MVRMGLTASLGIEPDIEVIAEAGNAEAAMEACQRTLPTLVLMDVRLPGKSGVECVQALAEKYPALPILMLSTHSGEEEIYRSLRAGARGYILKSARREDLLRAIREVFEGRRYLDPSVASVLAERLSYRPLTSRELEVLRLVAKGHGNKEIASTLHIAEVTVKLHVSHLLEKLNVKDRTEAATAALQRGIIALD